MRLRCESGFSLAEVLIALLVTVTGMLALAQLLTVTARAEGMARNGALASRMGQDKLDDLMKKSFTDPSLRIPPAGTGGSLTANDANYFDQPSGVITRRWLVTQGPSAGTRLVTVRVITISGMAARTVDLTTLVRQW